MRLGVGDPARAREVRGRLDHLALVAAERALAERLGVDLVLGRLDGGEQCDDANADETDGCTSLCRIAVCGDGVVEVYVVP